jgi:hypothetical protein
VIFPGLTVAEERALALRAQKLPVSDVRWRANGIVWSLTFFVLTVVALAATFWWLSELELPKGWLTLALALTLAELLIRRYRFFGTGVESALWIGGLFAGIFGLRGDGRPEALLLLAAASATAGFRVRNPVFGAASAAFVVAYLNARHAYELAAAVGLVVSLVALVALRREVQRPSTEWLWCALLLITPIAGAVASVEELGPAPALAYLGGAAACLAVGITSRAHAPLVGAAVHTAIAVATLVTHEVFPWRLEWRMIIGGAIVFAAAATLSRALRERQTGIVVTPEALTPYDEAIKVAGAIGLQAQPTSVEPPARESGGQFGGAGASGRF